MDNLNDLFNELQNIDDIAWGFYAFSRDILHQRISKEQQREIIKESISCGRDWARRLQKKGGGCEELAKELSLRVIETEQPQIENRILFAQFTPPNQVELMKKPLATYTNLYYQEKMGGTAVALPSPEVVKQLVLAHEIYHAVEEKYDTAIYTRKKKVCLWKVLCFSNYSTVRASGEIAAMSFARELTAVAFNPFLLDVLLYYGYSTEAAKQILTDVAQCKEAG